MTFLLGFHFGAAFFLTTVIYLFLNITSAKSFAAGASLAMLNLIALVFTWTHILKKKLVALSIGVIVFKFAILGWIIYRVVTGEIFQVGWFSAGLALVVLTALATALNFARIQAEEEFNSGKVGD